ncbi:MAG: hypothetical protein J6A19_08200 [Oscillospiraceae bacterium]|nr:hypothetical protein [Oscillospiraceae bacterium]
MAKVTLVGIHDMDFPTKDGGKIDGIALQVNYPDPNVVGLKAESKFISRDLCNNIGFTASFLTPFVGKTVELETNLKGKVIGISVVEG